MKHDFMACQGNICQTDPENTETTWIISEPFCSAKPYKKWQKVQAKIGRLIAKGKLKNPDSYFRLSDLERVKRVSSSIIGIVFDSRTDRTIFKTPPVAEKMPDNMPKQKED